MNDGIVCFKHCEDRAIFWKDQQITLCPLCKSEVRSYRLEPFQIPCPFNDASQEPLSIAIRPSTGSFLRDYTIDEDLHIAIVNSEGRIFEFDSCGVITSIRSSEWKESLTAPSELPLSWSSRWDELLLQMSTDPRWTRRNYHPINFNCFDFVIEFLRQLDYKSFVFSTKEQMCEFLLLPKLCEALKYTSLYRKLKQNNWFVPSLDEESTQKS